MAMLVDGLIPADVKFTSLFPRIMRRPTEPPIAHIAYAQESFVQGRPAIAASRTPRREAGRVIPEIDEARAELTGSMSRETLSGNFTEEVGDAAIFFVSAAGALGIPPHEIETAIEERFANHPPLLLPIRREARRAFLRERLDELEVTAAEITELIEQGFQDSDNSAAIRGLLMDGLHHALTIGEAVHPGMREKIVRKIDRNKGRFTEDEFTPKMGEPAEVRYVVAYIRQKVREGRLSPEDAYARLQSDPNILAYGANIDAHTLDLI